MANESTTTTTQMNAVTANELVTAPPNAATATRTSSCTPV